MTESSSEAEFVDKNFLEHAKNQKFIARVGAGMENIDVEFAKSLGIKLT